MTPGFVNIHSHADPEELPTAQSSLTQGVTSEIVNPDGGGPTDIDEQLRGFDSGGLALNVGAYFGFGAAWQEVVGLEDRSPTPEENAAMRQLVTRALEAGVWGVTTNLDAAPQTYASTEEVIEVVRAARDWRTDYASHLRSEGPTVIEATAEAIRIGEEAGLTPVITHMKAEGPSNWGKSVQTVGLIQAAIERGTYAAADAYPYLAGQSSLARRFIPRWAQEGGFDAMLQRFADPQLRREIAEESEALIRARLGTEDSSGAENIQIREGAHINRFVSDIAAEIGVRPSEAVMRILEEAGEDLSMIYHYGSQEDLNRIVQNSTTAGSCDCGATASPTTHPRNYGAFPRLLATLVREMGVLTWEDAIRKMTALPATTVGMADRGFIAEGMVADITIFDPETVVDRATYEQAQAVLGGDRVRARQWHRRARARRADQRARG